MSIIKKIQNLIGKSNSNSYNLSLLQVGDIVLAQENKQDNNEEHIYLIIHKTDQEVFGLVCQNSLQEPLTWSHTTFLIDSKNEYLPKNCYINTTNIINIKASKNLKKIDFLSPTELNKLKKALYISIKNNNEQDCILVKEDIQFYYEIGDIIKCNDNIYYIYKENIKYFYLYEIANQLQEKNKVLIGKKYYTINFNPEYKITKDSSIDLIDMAYEEEQKKIEEQKVEFLEQNDPRKEVAGSLISYRNHFYYIYGEDEEYYLTYRIYLSNEMKKNMVLLKIKEGRYYSYFEQGKIRKENEYKYKRRATKEEITEITKLSKMGKKERLNARYNKPKKK